MYYYVEYVLELAFSIQRCSLDLSMLIYLNLGYSFNCICRYTVYTYISSLINRHLSCFHFRTNINNTVLNIHLLAFSTVYLSSVITGSSAVLFKILLAKCPQMICNHFVFLLEI